MLKHFPGLTTVALSYAAAFVVFGLLGAGFFHNLLVPFGITGVFIAGAFYTYSFTASIGALLLIALTPHYPAGVIAVVGGTGALLSDLTIFNFIRNRLRKEVDRIANSAFICRIGARGIFCTRWFRRLLGVFILASPLPDELAIGLMSAAHMKKENFVLITFIADVLGIYALVSVAGLFY